MNNEEKKKTVIKNCIKWLLLLLLAGFAYIKNREFMHRAITEVGHTPLYVLLLAFLCGNLYFLFEGIVISRMTVTSEIRVNVPQGISCAYMCEFYRLATLGNGSGIAQVYYYYSKGLTVSRSLGICVSQYTFQKITISLMGIVSFFALVAAGDEKLLSYVGFMAAGAGVIFLICLFLFLIMVSRRVAELAKQVLTAIGARWKRFEKKTEDAKRAIDSLQDQARLVWGNKGLLITVILLDLLKQLSWYLIPGICFTAGYDVNLLYCTALMAVCNMLAGVMVAPSGIGTLDFTCALLFATLIPSGEVIAAAILIYRLFTWFLPFLCGLPIALLYRKK